MLDVKIRSGNCGDGKGIGKMGYVCMYVVDRKASQGSSAGPGEFVSSS